MKRIDLLSFVTTLCLCAGAAQAASPLATSFTYQGSLNQSGVPLDAAADFRFTLFDDPVAGASVGAPVTVNNVSVVRGLFTAPIDFGADVFNGNARWMQIEVRSPAGSGLFIKLAGRQPITATPYALQTRGLFTDAFLRVGVGTTTPIERLTVDGDLAIGHNDQTNLSTIANGAALTFRNPANTVFTSTLGTSSDTSGFTQLYSSRTGNIMALLEGDLDQTDDATTIGGLVLRSEGPAGLGGKVLVQNNDGKDRIELLGGGLFDGCRVSLFGTNDNVAVRIGGDFGGRGGELQMNDESGIRYAFIQPDLSGTGAFVGLEGGTPTSSFVFDGNAVGLGRPRIDINGLSPITIDQNLTGDASVVLSPNVISAGEILDEPGVANAHGTSVALGATLGAIASRSITVPGPGFVLAIADGDLQILHTNGTTSNIQSGVSTSATSLPADQDMQTILPSSMPTGTYDFSTSAHGLFTVNSAGTFTYFFTGQKITGNAVTMFDIQLTLIYFPTAYGTVVSNLNRGPGGASNQEQPRMPLSYDEIADEQEREFDRAQNQMAAEMQQMQTRIAQMQAHLSEIKAKQQTIQRGPETRTQAKLPRDLNLSVKPIGGMNPK